MDKYTTREARLWILSRRLVTGEMTEQERAEYKALNFEQAEELKQALITLTKRDMSISQRIKRYISSLWR